MESNLTVAEAMVKTAEMQADMYTNITGAITMAVCVFMLIVVFNK
jgi:hypothetical protein